MPTRPLVALAAAAAVSLGGLTAVPASAGPEGDDLVIAEAYLNGGSTGATFKNKFVELYNPTDEPIDVDGWSVQYRSATGSGTFTTIPIEDHFVEPGGTLLVSGNANAANGAELPTPDVVSTVAFSGSAGGTLALSRSTSALSGDRAAILASPNLVDLVGYGTSTTFEGTGSTPAGRWSVTSSIQRTNGLDTDQNATDFTGGAPTPTPCGTDCDGSGEPPAEPVDVPIAEIQGTGDASPLVGDPVVTRGVVTAAYPTGGFDGVYLQTPGTGGDLDLGTHTASDGVFVESAALADAVQVGDHLEVRGDVAESFGLTQVEVAADGWTVLDEPAEAVKPATVSFPLGVPQRESLEGMLLAPQGDYTITNNFATNTFGEIGLASGTSPLPQPTDVVRPRTEAYTALVAENARRLITLDDGSSASLRSDVGRDTPLPWLRPDNEVRVGAPVDFTQPMVLDQRFGWKLQPTQQLVAGGEEPVVIGDTRTAAPEDVAGPVRLATFNVLNYFSTTGADWEAAGGSCDYFTDRDGEPVTTDDCGDGPRGAADEEDFERQEAKIVAAITALDADVVTLEEIENSAALGLARDDALETLVAALNEGPGADEWAPVPSPATVPTQGEDVIRTALIYKPAALELVGTSRILDSPAFVNARAPLAQGFKRVGVPGSEFVTIVNHFKSKGSGSGANADQGDGQGASNLDRTKQATALVGFADEVSDAVGTSTVFLTGDFNSYTQEDPVKIIEDAGYVNVTGSLTGEDTYQFDGQVGSLDHVFVATKALGTVKDADIWNINAYESLAREYSRFNDNVVNLYDESPYRSSDHDPALIGFDPAPGASSLEVQATGSVRLGGTVTVRATVESTRPATGTVTVSEDGAPLGSATLDEDGTATVELDSEDLGVGTHELTVSYGGGPGVAAASEVVSVRVLKALTVLEGSTEEQTYGRAGRLTVTTADDASGLLYVAAGSEVVGVGSLTDGAGSVVLDATALEPGDHDLRVFFGGDETHEPTDVDVEHAVVKAPVSVRATVSPSKVVAKKTRATARVTVRATGFTVPDGTVQVKSGSKVLGTGTVTAGVATVTLPTFAATGTRNLVLAYSGGSLTVAGTGTLPVRIVSR